MTTLKSEKLWLGTEASFNDYLLRHEQPVPPELTAKYAARDEEEGSDPLDDVAEDLIEVYGSVGVLSIKGSLVQGESVFDPFWGDVGYGSIARALNMLLEDAGVKSIVLDFETGGGDAAGVSEAGYAIAAANTQKPVYAWASTALSAGMWLASSARKIYAAQLSQLGSIGAVSVFTGIAPMLKEAGYEVHVARSSKNKAVPNRLEPLTDQGKKVLNDTVATIGGFFVDHMLRARPSLSSSSQTTWADGSVFFGQRAHELGLCDGLLASVSELVQMAETAHNTAPIASSPSSYSYSAGDIMAKKLVLAQLADLAAARISMGLDPETAVPVIAASEGPGDEEDTDEDEGEVSASANAQPSEPSTPVAAVLMSADDGLSAYLKEEVTTLKAEVATLKTELATYAQTNVQLQTANATISHLRPVAEAAVQRLSIGLGHRPSKLEHLPADLLASMFTDLQAELMALPAGRQTAEPSIDEVDGARPPDTLAQHRLRLVPQAR